MEDTALQESPERNCCRNSVRHTGSFGSGSQVLQLLSGGSALADTTLAVAGGSSNPEMCLREIRAGDWRMR
jgi:hypothetical protein